MTVTEKREAIQDLLAHMSQGDWESVAEAYQDDVVVDWPQSGERMRGKQACLEVFRTYPGGPPRVESAVVRVDGDLGVAQGEITYPDGSRWTAISVFEFRDGKIARETDWFAQPFEPPEWRAHLVERITR